MCDVFNVMSLFGLMAPLLTNPPVQNIEGIKMDEKDKTLRENDWFFCGECAILVPEESCGIEPPRSGNPCVLIIDHEGNWHMDADDHEWYGKPDC